MIYRLLYQIRNWKAHWRALYMGAYVSLEGIAARWSGKDRVTLHGRLDATLIRKDGKRVFLGCLGRRVVTTAGVNYMRDDFNNAAGSADITNFKYHGSGTGTTAEAITDTALVNEGAAGIPARATGTQVGTVSGVYTTVGSQTYTGTLAITEHGVFSAATSGTLWDRTVFAAVNVVSGESISFSYSLTITAGG